MGDTHGDFVLEWLQRARSGQIAKQDNVPIDGTNQLKRATWVLFILQVTLLVLFAAVGGEDD